MCRIAPRYVKSHPRSIMSQCAWIGCCSMLLLELLLPPLDSEDDALGGRSSATGSSKMGLIIGSGSGA